MACTSCPSVDLPFGVARRASRRRVDHRRFAHHGVIAERFHLLLVERAVEFAQPRFLGDADEEPHGA
jgi:hypothetical protein